MSKRIIPNIIFTSENINELPDYSLLSQNKIVKSIVCENTFIGIKEAIKKRSKNAKIIEVNSSGYYITIGKEDYKTALDNVIGYYETLEDYETCAEIMNLKKQL